MGGGEGAALPVREMLDGAEGAVGTMLEGLVLSRPTSLAMLPGYPAVKVVARADLAAYRETHVTLISGGGSGHEPAHAGLVGAGLLSCAVCGDVFASPSVDAVLAAIRAAAGPPGCLLIVKNYTGDRLNFGLAAERAQAEFGIRVGIVVVGDDAALPVEDAGAEGMGFVHAGRRGVAGTVLVHKVAGHVAAEGGDLDAVRDAALAVCRATATVGAALSVCHVPGAAEDRAQVPRDAAELGLGIHGEPGFERLALPAAGGGGVASFLVGKVLERMTTNGDLFPLGVPGRGRVVLLANNLGGATAMELGVISAAAQRWLREHGCAVVRTLVGNFMTALDMRGFSLTLLRLPADADEAQAWLAALDRAVDAVGWPSGHSGPAPPDGAVPFLDASTLGGSAATAAAAGGEAPAAPTTPAGAALRRALRAAGEALESPGCEVMLNAMDRAIGDGDCGSTFRRGGADLLAALGAGRLDCDDPASCVARLADMASALGGSTGALYSIGLYSAARSLGETASDPAQLTRWAMALDAALDAVEFHGGARVGHRTMLDALRPASSALLDAATRASKGTPFDLADALKAVAHACKEGAGKTALLKTAKAGRASYLADLQDTPDPGAAAAATWVDAVCRALARPASA